MGHWQSVSLFEFSLAIVTVTSGYFHVTNTEISNVFTICSSLSLSLSLYFALSTFFVIFFISICPVRRTAAAPAEQLSFVQRATNEHKFFRIEMTAAEF